MRYKTIPLGEVANITKLAGFEFTKYISYDDTGEIIALRALNLRDGELDLSDVKRIKKSASESLERSKLYENDILLTYTGNGYGDCAIITESNKYHLAPNICKISPFPKLIYPYFLYSYIRSKIFYSQMTNHMVGSSQPTIPMKTIRLLEVPLPPLEIQKKIVDVLYSLDEKVRLNKQINKNLEWQAQAIYDSTFIAGAKPTWPQGHLSDLVTVKYGKDHKRLADGRYPVFGSGGVMRYVERPLYDKESVLIPRKGTLNNVMYANEPFWSVDTMFYTEMKLPNVAKFVYHFVKSKNLASMNAGSAVPSMTTDILNAMELTIPDTDTLAKFENLVAPMYLMMEENDKQSRKLSVIRDTLLPKLIVGEIDVRSINI